MKITGFTFIKNAVQYDYPIIEAIQSILPICDEFIIAHGNSEDGTQTLLETIDSPKIKIIRTVWDETIRGGEAGRAFALETEKAFHAISEDTDWAFYIQGDECVHEKYLETIKKEMEICLNDKSVNGLLFNYKHFYGSYDYFAHSRRWYRREIRIIRNIKGMTSYIDAQGFRYNNEKIKVKHIDAYIYHYGWVKPPKGLTRKVMNFTKFYDKEFPLEEDENVVYEDFDYGNADNLVRFKETHPNVFQERVNKTNWKFDYDPTLLTKKMSIRRKFLAFVETVFGIRLFEYKNYKKIK